MSVQIFVLIVWLTAMLWHQPSKGERISQENVLIESLLVNRSRIGKLGRPVYNASDVVEVAFGMGLINILNVDEQAQVVKLKVWENYLWRDDLMTWNPVDFYGVKQVAIPTDEIWVPDIILYNSVKDLQKSLKGSKCLLTHTGEITWIPETVINAFCPIDVTYFPNDVHNCTLSYASWLYRSSELQLKQMKNESEFDISSLQENKEWSILEHPVWTTTLYYPEFGAYTNIHFAVIMKRNAAYYNFVIIYPSVLLSSLTPIMFLTPPSCHDRNSFGTGIFGAFFLLLLIVADLIPQAMVAVPKCGVYIFCNMLLVVLCLLCNALVTSLHDNSEEKPMWRCLRSIIRGVPGAIFCLPKRRGKMKSDSLNKKGDPLGCDFTANDWKLLSMLLDRALFLIYVIINIILFAVLVK